MTTLTFQKNTLSVINQRNQIWLTANDIGKALGYSQSVVGVNKLYTAHQDEFTPNMTALIDMPTAGGIQKVRIFSLRGCHLIGMLSHTKVAKDFRKWVLDILDKETQQPQQIALPEPEPTYTLELTQSQFLRLSSLWFALYNDTVLLEKLVQPLEALGSRLAPVVYSNAREYKITLGVMQRILLPHFEQINIDNLEDGHYRKSIATLRAYQPTGLGKTVII